jgi:UDP-N-acetylglucosamine--N-acetylmuramyl-(pentapeptide) pyrophosphoryl-undecaprenol N-acetylglucosamine transferase
VRLVIAGGGTGGHLFPGIAVAEEFLDRDPANEVLFVGTERGIEARVLPRLGYRLECIAATGMRRVGFVARLKGSWLLLAGYLQSKRIIGEFRPDLVLGVGGYSSGPLVLAARLRGCRCFIHEQNAHPGLTNRLLARLAKRVFISIEDSKKYLPGDKCFLTGNPPRKQIVEGARQGRPEGDDSGVFNLLVFGGSAGAHHINMAMIEALPRLSGFGDRLAIMHQTGESDYSEVREAYGRAGMCAEVAPFIDDMAGAYGRADLVVCRAGATTIAEVTVSGKACIFIPYPYAVDDHQRKNAEALLERGAGFMILDRELSGEALAKLIGELVRDPEKLANTGRNAAALGRPDAASEIVDAMLAGT